MIVYLYVEIMPKLRVGHKLRVGLLALKGGSGALTMRLLMDMASVVS